jgi:2-amino-4-hydroxy-6-hydroxymethyldihydropteridine diphosphokinase
MAVVYLGLGTNLGDRGANLRRALRSLSTFAEIEAVSSVYETEPVGFREQPDFWNLVVRIRTALPPAALLAAVKEIERELGRQPSFRNAPRVIDLDLLLYDGQTISTPDLTIPHPRLLERAFVLRPLVEIGPELRHPGTNRKLSDHLAEATGLERAEPIFPGEELLGDET